MIGPLIVDVWEHFYPTIKSPAKWQKVLCAFGTGLSDVFGPLVTGGYGAVNVLLLD